MMTNTDVGESLLSQIGSGVSNINEIMAFIGVSGIAGIISYLVYIVKKREDLLEFFFRSYIQVKSRDYYTDAFLQKNISKAKEKIIIFCVRNLRISGTDIMQELKKACDKGVEVKLYWMSTEVEDSIIQEIMVTLPTPAATVIDYKQQVKDHRNIIVNEVARWSRISQGKISVYTYHTLPTMHFCCFDKKIYVGFQIYNPNDDIESRERLGDYCIVVKTNSRLGKLILKQIELLGDKIQCA